MKTLVIDASVALGAGGGEKVKPACRPCRDFLISVLEGVHQLSWSAPIAAEWKKHAASFARHWRVQMFARRRVIRTAAPEVPGLRVRIAEALANSKERAAAEKDHHLLLAALDSDRTIASLDETVRALFSKACKSAQEVRGIVWVNPDDTTESPLDWLAKDAPAEAHRLLQNFER